MYKIILPPREKIIKTGPDDSGPDRYYSKNYFIKKIYWQRLQSAVDLVGDKKYERLLEIGYGNGALSLTLIQLVSEYYGIDIHGREKEISGLFAGNFMNGSIYSIPFSDSYFDCLFCLSVLEHLDDLPKAFSEIERVMKNDGDIIIGIPSDNIFMKLFFWLKKSPALESHINSRRKLLELIRNNFNILDINTLRIFGIDIYTSVKCQKLKV